MDFAALLNPSSSSKPLDNVNHAPAADIHTETVNDSEDGDAEPDPPEPAQDGHPSLYVAAERPSSSAVNAVLPPTVVIKVEDDTAMDEDEIVAESEDGDQGLLLLGAPLAMGDTMDVDAGGSGTAPGFSPSSSSLLIPDSDPEEETRRRVGALEEELLAAAVSAASGSGTRVKQEDEEGTVNVMGIDSGDDEAPSARKLQPLRRPKPTAAPRRPHKSKASKSRLHSSAPSSRPNSPLPHQLQHDLTLADGGFSTDTSREGSPALPARDGGAASSGRNSPAPYPFAFPGMQANLALAADARRTVVPSEAERGLSAPFATYAPPRGTESEEDEAGKVQKRKGKGRMKEVEKEEEEEEGDDRLYCVCRQLYDPERTMIACDKCENWYHLDCVDIPDEKVDLVDQFICPICQKSSTERTTWKAACARPTCLRAVAPLSKYCSDYCGVEVAATRLELSGIAPEKFWAHVVGARRREAVVLDVQRPEATSQLEAVQHEEAEDERVLKGLQRRLSDVVARRTVLDANLALVVLRLQYLRVVIKRWEVLCKATVDAIAAQGLDVAKSSKSKSKSKKSGTGGSAVTSHPDAPCGFDVRLVHDSQTWEAWIGSEEGRLLVGQVNEEEEVADGALEDLEEDNGIICLRSRKKCERHTGWQKVRQADFEVESAVLKRRLERLAHQERRIRLQIEDHEEASRFRALYRNRTGEALAVEGRMQVSPQTTPKKKGLGRAVGGSAGGVLVNAKVVPADDQPSDTYEVPPELFHFLSRSEQLRLKRQAGL